MLDGLKDNKSTRSACTADTNDDNNDGGHKPIKTAYQDSNINKLKEKSIF